MDNAALTGPAMLFAVIIAITLVSFGVSDLRHGRRGRGAWMVVGGFLLVAIPVGTTLGLNAYREWASWEHTVGVQGLEARGEFEFTVDMRHQADSIIYLDDSERQDAREYSFTYRLRDAGTLDDVIAVFQEQHPNGVSIVTRPYVHGDFTSAWHVYLDGARYDLFDIEDGSFDVATQVAFLEEDHNAEPALIPFPSGSSPNGLTPEVTTYLTDLTSEDWHDFYSPIDGVQMTATSISVPTSDGRTATLTFAEDPEGLGLGFKVTISD